MPVHLNINIDGVFKTADRIMDAVSSLILTLTGYLSSFILSFTIPRAFLAAWLIPIYICKLVLRMASATLYNFIHILTPAGWSRLSGCAEVYRSLGDTLAHAQLEGRYKFKQDEVFHVEKEGLGWMPSAPFGADTHEFDVCGASVRYIHLRASYSSILQDGRRSHRPVVFLHGNPSWSYTWRNVFPSLLERGHDVYAIDWLGHGRSDKILDTKSMSIELHIRTLVRFFEVTEVRDAILAAHDWGGYVLCLP